MSYASLRLKGFLPGRLITPGDDPPFAPLGSGFSKMDPYLVGDHHGVKLSADERAVIWRWFDCGALNAGTYAAVEGLKAPRATIHDVRGGKQHGEAGAVLKACADCHAVDIKTGKPAPHMSFPLPAVNLSRPEKSLALLAPLPKPAGGLGLCKDVKTGKPPEAIPSRESAAYRAMLAWCQAAAQRARDNWIASASFRPPDPYLMRMKLYGLLPADFDPAKTSVDVFELDQRYYRSHWRPVQKTAAAK